MRVICTKCGRTFFINNKEGETTDNTLCERCGGKLIEPDISEDDLLDLCRVKKVSDKPGIYVDLDLYYAMVDLKKKDPIEYSLKMAQFHEIAEKDRKKQWDSNPLNQKAKCPHCKSTNIKKIGVTSRMLSIGFFGLGSSKIGKQWHCNQCGSNF